ncbi:MAG: hypothetical protein KC609_07085 [Myxococcales bacterium]|nr:hypothetical protein [Myxococcales bacterium]
MKHRRQRHWIIALFALIALAFAACVGTDDSTTTKTTSVDDGLSNLGLNENALASDDGMLNTDDEQPSFGDKRLEGSCKEQPKPEGAPDEIVDKDGDVQQAENERPSIYVRLIWGKLRLTPGAEKIDFSGSVSVNGAAIKVKRLIRFEHHNDLYDRLLRRDNRSVVAWNSLIFSHNDGILLKVIDLPSSTDAVKTFKFETKAYSFSLPLAELKGLHKIFRVDDKGNVVAISAFEHRPFGCPKGFLEGGWKRLNEKGGVFGGPVEARSGRLIGHMRGIWGVRPDGERVAFAKIVALNGRFRGLVKGTWMPDEDGIGGTFKARVFNRDKLVVGVLHGNYRPSTAIDDGGFYKGVWSKICDGPQCPQQVVDGVDVDASTCGEPKPQPEDACEDNETTDCPEIAPKPIAGFCCNADSTVTQDDSTVGCQQTFPALEDAQHVCHPDQPSPFQSQPQQ